MIVDRLFFFPPSFLSPSHSDAMDNSESLGPKRILVSARDPGADPAPKATNPALSPQPDLASGAISGQKTLSKPQALGIKAIEYVLLANNGGISSGTPLPSTTPLPSSPITAPLGPASNSTSITRSYTAPAIMPVSHLSQGTLAIKKSTYAHFKMKPLPKSSATGKAIAENAVANVSILADVLRVMENWVEGVVLESASVWGLSRSRSHSRSRSKSSERADSELPGRVEEIEFQVEQLRNDLNARLLVLERHVPTLPPITGITAADVQKATVQCFGGLITDINVLNDGLYDQSKKQSDINATLRTKMAALEADNESLRTNYAEQGRMLVALQVAISHLEITSTAPLVLRTHGILPQCSRSPPRLNHQPFCTPSRSPPQGQVSKHLPLDDPNGFIVFRPLTDK
ncbi:hypothetical protein K438DRAFT_1991364 [Mycena galopus ATCC 62051]|nr:hypothetical protein K438DRAFT_1991364 [Mycena galopus ATCC 62051]